MRRAPLTLLAVALVLVAASSGLAEHDRGLCRVQGGDIGRVPVDLLGPEAFHDACVHLNQVQVLGSHNSYHVQPAPGFDALLRLFNVPGCGGPDLPCGFELSAVWEYSHVALDRQFGLQGIRQVELDVFLDPEGGRYAFPLGAAIAPGDPDPDPEGLLLEPGLKVLHVQDLDFRSSCLTLEGCLEIIQEWSADHPRHLPILVLIELKDEPLPDVGFPFVVPLPFEAEDLDELDELIRAVVPRRQLLIPDDVRGGRKSLEKAVLKDGWPTLEQSRGRLIFALDNGGRERALYLEGHPSLEGRVLFTDSSPGEPEAAFMKRNDPLASFDEIQELVARGYIVRTRADADTLEARFGDVTRRDAALTSGAQYISTDYPVPDPDFGTGYFVEIPGGDPARCNPISAPLGCLDRQLER